MRNFILGILVTLVILVLGGLSFALLGFMPTHSNATPPHWEQRIAMSALDASMEKHAPRVNNPVPPTDQNLIEGMKVYTMNCAVCHGPLNSQPSALEKKLYPPAPQLILEPMDDEDWHIYYAVRTGIRYTGMPAWEGVLTEDQMWKVTGFLSHIEKLPPGVQDYWKNSVGVAPPGHGEGGGQEH